ncbi:5-(carboxyamino)imidazole ribonucleotide synthase [Alteromonas sp. KUL49]|uniref:5-(carboxyamino)imidazole ribonucleotide synthase n=1 Tax=Alteromonas sp. KUL49 TaxID=2480798 RepID=UPI00102F261F|nr:5-(carboxyamino)imidazole ribonucleotide synthase [Alteromonas sp. KUL49]TAP42581.1 5-(carboxyamino)imidazole ribonucleotide synthase [Alteromonas sp. KUL49]GEA10218.1 N5-carboxyaminoimidazole ribonucleotide synthase [Alteromonas sp. KUL49]
MRVVVYGAGQLAQMMYLAGSPLGIQVEAVDVSNDTVVHPVSKQPLDITLAQAIETADALTVEFEHVPERLLEDAASAGKLMPNIESILVGADRVREKKLLEKMSVANCKHRIVTDVEQLDACVEALGEKLIIKSSRDGYDGYGQWRLSEAAELPALKNTLSDLDLQKVPLVVEQMMAFDRELSLIGVRNKQGDIRTYPLAENLHHQGQLHVSVAPATDTNDALQQQAHDIFTALAEGMDYVGVLAVELFQQGDKLYVNELAPRVHNSGHWSQSGAVTSQFENHLRAVCGLPLGDTAAIGPSAMVNIIGCSSFSRDLLSIDGSHLHWYGKSVREKRKMGHINVTTDSYENLGEKLMQLSQYLPLEYFPKLVGEAKRLKG